MTTWVYLPLLLSVALPWAARWAADALHPATAVRALTVSAAIAATSWAACLMLLALTLFDDLPPLAQLDDRPELGLPEPVPGVVALFAVVVLALGALRAGRELRRRHQTVTRLRNTGVPRFGLVIADMPEPIAMAVPGNPGHILITSGMLRLLDDRERHAVFAHETAHLRHHHHWWITASALAAAVHPALAPLARHLSYLAERWADEDAAADTGDRGLVARAIAKAALATGPLTSPVMGVHGTGPAARVAALCQPTGHHQWQRLAGPAVVCAILIAATGMAAVEFHDVAQAWITTHQRAIRAD